MNYVVTIFIETNICSTIICSTYLDWQITILLDMWVWIGQQIVGCC